MTGLADARTMLMIQVVFAPVLTPVIRLPNDVKQCPGDNQRPVRRSNPITGLDGGVHHFP
jgi:hypothetical protein